MYISEWVVGVEGKGQLGQRGMAAESHKKLLIDYRLKMITLMMRQVMLALFYQLRLWGSHIGRWVCLLWIT